ncbi:MAG: DUF1624 domain-containing protein [Burkholderiales bacterium]|nr:MAG: DUF1624 domain-containing protein [Burkholderiales bacterium]
MSRLPALDALRGLALLAMAAFHFVFDLNFFGYLRQDFYNDPFWLHARSLILTSFLVLAGFSLSLAQGRADASAGFWRRILRLAAAAALVSFGSWLAFPASWIYFGVLHFLLVASLLAWPLVRLGYWNLLFALALIALGNGPAFPAFASPWLHWLGFAPSKPITEDYVPLAPWLAAVLVGMVCAGAKAGWLPAQLARYSGAAPRGLAWLGRHSLGFYILHQPVFFALLTLVKRGAPQ